MFQQSIKVSLIEVSVERLIYLFLYAEVMDELALLDRSQMFLFVLACHRCDLRVLFFTDDMVVVGRSTVEALLRRRPPTRTWSRVFVFCVGAFGHNSGT